MFTEFLFAGQDGLFVKHLKDCAFPLPMSTLGGATTAFSSFEGALLDVRYWSKQRSAIEIIDSMHRLIELTDPGNPSTAANNLAATATAGEKSKTNKKKQSLDDSSAAALSDEGLVAWWTFEDGPGGKKRVTDVTTQRFKTPIDRPAIHSLSYPIPEEVIAMLPPSFAWMVPTAGQEEAEEVSVAVSAAVTTASTGKDTAPRPTTAAQSKVPVDVMLASWPASRWLDAELMPQGYKHKSAAVPLKGTPTKAKAVDGAAVVATKLLSIGNSVNRAAAGRKKPGHSASGESKKSAGESDAAPPVKKAAAPNMFKDSGSLPVPSFRQRGLCPFEIRRFRLACSGREMQREVDCPLGELKISFVKCDTLTLHCD